MISRCWWYPGGYGGWQDEFTLVSFGWSLLLSQVRRAWGHASDRQRHGSSLIKFLCSVPERWCWSDFSVVGQRGKLDDRHFRSGVTIRNPAAKSLRGMAKSILTNRSQFEQQVFTLRRIREFPEEMAPTMIKERPENTRGLNKFWKTLPFRSRMADSLRQLRSQSNKRQLAVNGLLVRHVSSVGVGRIRKIMKHQTCCRRDTH